MAEHVPRYAVSISLEEAAFGCHKIIDIKTSEKCPSCNGSGKSSSSAVCPGCQGTGRLYQTYPLPVDIPAGVEDGYQLHVKPKASPQQKGKIPGELDVLVSVKAHKLFRRAGADIIYELSLNFPQVALGTEVMVPTLKEEARLKISPGTQTGKIFRLKGKGIPRFGKKNTGDLLVHVTVLTPTSLDEHQRELLEQLAAKLPQPHIGKASP